MLNLFVEKSYRRINGGILPLAMAIFMLFLFMVLAGEAQGSYFTFSKWLVIGTSFAALSLLVMAYGICWVRQHLSKRRATNNFE